MGSPGREIEDAPTESARGADGTASVDKVNSLISEKIEQSADPDLKAGDVVGEYEVRGKIGAGGFGTVYSAEHPLIGKSAAVKVLNREFSSNPQMVSRFISEARAANTIGHSNIIDVFSFGTLDDGRHYYVMELLEGLSFEQFLAQSGPVPPSLVVHIMRAVGRALDAAHKKDIVHRDLKPDNIFLSFDEDGKPVPKLLDFGIAKLMGDTALSSGHKTRTGTPVGTPHYMAPEQCLGLKVDHRCNVYAFGVVCFEALTGRPPFEGTSYLELMHKQTSAPRPKVSTHCPAIGEHFDDAILAMMAIDQLDRPESLNDAIRLLEDAAAAAGVALDHQVNVPESKRRPDKSGKSTPSEFASADTVATGKSGVGRRRQERAAPANTAAAAREKETRAAAVPAGGSSKGSWLFGVAAFVAGIAIFMLLSSDDPPPAASNQPDASSTAAQPGTATASAQTGVAAMPAKGVPGERIEINVWSTREGVAFLGDRNLGEIPAILPLKATGETVTLRIVADNCDDTNVEVLLDRSKQIEVKPHCRIGPQNRTPALAPVQKKPPMGAVAKDKPEGGEPTKTKPDAFLDPFANEGQ